MEVTIQEKLKIALDFLDTQSAEDTRVAYNIIKGVIADLEKSFARYNAHLTGDIQDVKVDSNEQFEEIE